MTKNEWLQEVADDGEIDSSGMILPDVPEITQTISSDSDALVVVAEFCRNVNNHVLRGLAGLPLGSLIMHGGQHNSVLQALLMSAVEFITPPSAGSYVKIVLPLPGDVISMAYNTHVAIEVSGQGMISGTASSAVTSDAVLTGSATSLSGSMYISPDIFPPDAPDSAQVHCVIDVVIKLADTAEPARATVACQIRKGA